MALGPGEILTAPLEDVFADAVGSIRDPNSSVRVAASLTARVSLDAAKTQEKTTRELLEATHDLVQQSSDLVKQTSRLAWATIGVAAITGISALIVAFGVPGMGP